MKKALKSIADSWFGYLVGSVFLTGIGGLIGGLLTGAFVGIYAGLAYGDEIVGMTDAQEIASTMMGLLPDWLATGQAYLASIGVWLVALLWFLRKANKPIWKAIDRRSAGNNFRNLMIGFALGAALNGFCAFAACMLGSISLDFSSFNIAYALILLVCVFVQSSAEELVCRGYLHQKLLNKYKRPVVAIVGNAAIFAAFHLLNPGVTVLSIVDIVVCGILEWSRYFGLFFKRLQAMTRSESDGARYPDEECILRVLQYSSMYLNASCFASSLVAQLFSFTSPRFSVLKNDSATALSRGFPGRGIDCAIPCDSGQRWSAPDVHWTP